MNCQTNCYCLVEYIHLLNLFLAKNLLPNISLLLLGSWSLEVDLGLPERGGAKLYCKNFVFVVGMGNVDI